MDGWLEGHPVLTCLHSIDVCSTAMAVMGLHALCPQIPLLLPTWTTDEYFIFWTPKQTQFIVHLNWFDRFFVFVCLVVFFGGNPSFSVLLFLQSTRVHPLGMMWWFCFSNYGLFLPLPPLFLFSFYLCTLFLLESPPSPFTLQTHRTKTKFLSPRCAQCTQARC